MTRERNLLYGEKLTLSCDATTYSRNCKKNSQNRALPHIATTLRLKNSKKLKFRTERITQRHTQKTLRFGKSSNNKKCAHCRTRFPKFPSSPSPRSALRPSPFSKEAPRPARNVCRSQQRVPRQLMTKNVGVTRTAQGPLAAASQ